MILSILIAVLKMLERLAMLRVQRRAHLAMKKPQAPGPGSTALSALTPLRQGINSKRHIRT